MAEIWESKCPKIRGSKCRESNRTKFGIIKLLWAEYNFAPIYIWRWDDMLLERSKIILITQQKGKVGQSLHNWSWLEDTCKIGGRCIKTFRYYYLIVITLLRRHCKEKFLILFLTCRKTSYLRGFNCVSSLPPSIWHILHYDFSRFSKWIYDSRDNREERVFLDKLGDWSVLGWDKTILQYWKWNGIFIQRWANLSHVFISKKWPSEHFQTRYESFNGTKVDLSSLLRRVQDERMNKN